MSTGTWESYHAITTLMYRYTECIDAADFDGIGELFAHGEITNRGVEGAIVGAEAVRGALHAARTGCIRTAPLMTRHLCTNVIVDIDESAGRGDCPLLVPRVLQATPALPLQPIVAGRYRDTFARAHGEWRFAQREMVVEQVGDVSDHLLIDLGLESHDRVVGLLVR